MKLIHEAAAVGAGGFAGAIVRHFVIGLTGTTVGIISVNVGGCLLLGFLTGDSKLTLFLATGFLGALTTFSTFSGHSVRLWNSGETMTAVLFILINVIAGIAAFMMGMGVRGRVFP